MKLIYVPKKFILDDSITGLDLAVYAQLSLLMDNDYFEEFHFHTSDISYCLFKNYKQTANIQHSLARIVNSGYFDCKQLKPNNFVFKAHSLDTMNDSFVCMPYWIIQKIIESKYTYKFELIKLCYLIMALRSLEFKNSKGYPYLTIVPLKTYMGYMKINAKNTALKYMTTLEKLEIIYIQRTNHSANRICFIMDKNNT